MRWEADLRAAVQYLRGDAMMRAREREVKVGAKREVKVKGVGAERWMKPFKNLPETANWIAVDSDGMCYWYEVRPRCMVWVWSFGSEGVANWMKRLKRPSDWKNAVREVQPEERVGYKPEWVGAERWMKPFKNLPAEATWVAVNSSRACFWYQNRPSRGVAIWLPSDLTRVSLYGHIANDVEISDWETAIRPVMPEERINYVKDVKP